MPPLSDHLDAQGPQGDGMTISSPLDIIDGHELRVMPLPHNKIDLRGVCTCGEFQATTPSTTCAPKEFLIDAFMKHVQAVRDAMRGVHSDE